MSFISTVEKDGKKLVSVLELIGKDSEKTLVVAAKYLPEAAVIAELLFPAEAPAIAAGTSVALNVANLIQNAVAEVEVKASALPAGLTNEQKSADVLAIVSSVVIANLATLGIKNADTSYVQSLINAVVAILNIPSVAA